MKNLSEIELAYLAGLTDGEGCLTMQDNGTGCIRPVYQLIMSDEDTVQWVADIAETPARRFAKHRALPHHKDQFRMKLTGERAVELTTALHPYLRIKKNQAEVFMEWMTTKHVKNPERDIVRLNLKNRIHALNDDRRPAHMELRSNG